VLYLSRLPAEGKLRQILILGQEIIQAARRSAVALLRVCLESLSVYPIAFMMILGKDAAVGAPREFVPATADFSVQEPSLTQKAMFTNQALVRANRAIDARAFAPNPQPLALTDVFHNDDRVSGDAANVLDQRLEHGRVGNVLQHGNREAQIDRAVLEGQMCAIDRLETCRPSGSVAAHGLGKCERNDTNSRG
jgi:hypothetical protein